MPSSRGYSHPRIEPTSLKSPALTGGFFTTSATWAAQGGLQAQLKPGICLSHFISAFLPSLWFLSRLAFPSRWQK